LAGLTDWLRTLLQTPEAQLRQPDSDRNDETDAAYPRPKSLRC